MKWIILIISFLLIPITFGIHNINRIEPKKEISEWDRLWVAISIVESGIDDNAKNPHSTATGRYQSLKCIPIEANRILSRNEYSFDDRLDSIRALEMIEVIQSHYNPTKSIDRAIRLHSVGFARDSLAEAQYKTFSKKVYREMKNHLENEKVKITNKHKSILIIFDNQTSDSVEIQKYEPFKLYDYGKEKE